MLSVCRSQRGVAAIRVKPTPNRSGEAQWHHQQTAALWDAYFFIFVILVCTLYSSFLIFQCGIYSDMNLNIDAVALSTSGAPELQAAALLVKVRRRCTVTRHGTTKASNAPARLGRSGLG